MTRQAAINLLLEIASQDVGERERKPNEATWIKPLWQFTSAPEIYESKNWREKPYCAAGMCAIMGRFIRSLAEQGELKATLGMSLAQAEKWRCKDPSAWGWMTWSDKRGLPMLTEQNAALPGDLVVFDTHHIGFVTSAKGDVIQTIEYNTNGKGERDGDGCWRKIRPREAVQRLVRIL